MLWRSSVVLAVLVGCLLAAPAAFAASGSISGTVTAASGGAAVKGVEVCAYYEGSEEVEPSCESTTSNGEYTLANLPAGGYLVAFWAEDQGYAPQF